MKIIATEIDKRLPLTNESKRLFHGRGHCFPGYEDIFIDWFSPALLVSLYAEREKGWIDNLIEMLIVKIPALKSIYIHDRYKKTDNVRIVYGQKLESLRAVEGGLSYHLRLGDAQNTGFFLDMAKGRAMIRSNVCGKKVLNLFSYTCSFSVAALAGKACSVVNVDMNRGALEMGKANHQLNGQDLRQASFVPLELFRSFSRIKQFGPFDLVICDPPAYQGKSFKAERDWPKLLRKLPDVMTDKGEILACLNGPHLPPVFLKELFESIRPEMQLASEFQPGEDFPEKFPERGSWCGLYRFNQAD